MRLPAVRLYVRSEEGVLVRRGRLLRLLRLLRLERHELGRDCEADRREVVADALELVQEGREVLDRVQLCRASDGL